MNVLLHTDPKFAEQIKRLSATSSLFDPLIEQQTRAIVEAVQVRGDAAVLDFTERFDGAKLNREQLSVTDAELITASFQASEPLRAAVAEASKNIENFAKKSLRKNWLMRNAHGATVGEKFDPFTRIGIYIPGGTAPLVSTALMTIPLARVAGCREIVVCTPCNQNGEINPALLYAARTAGATEIYRIGGAQAIAAMALGTDTIRPVQKIFGPGNAYVVAAKRLVFGRVSIDLLPGPSELLVLGDDTANAAFIAADLLAQAEHGSGHERVWFLTPSAKLLRAVQKEVYLQIPKLARREFVQRALSKNGWLLHVENIEQAIQLTNQLAPEHCEIITRNAAQVSAKILTAGAIFLGSYSPTVMGDYVAGPSHTLPTGGAGQSFAGLTVDQFQRRTSVVEYDRSSLQKALTAVQQFAKVEGLAAHGRSAEIRLEPSKANSRPSKQKSSARPRS
jgi:histidinol dehydrogenase